MASPEHRSVPDSMERNTEEWTAGYLAVGRNRFLETLRRSFQSNVFNASVQDRAAKILDVGCGNGTFLSMLMKRGYTNVFGVEPNGLLVESLKAKSPELGERVKQGVAQTLPYPDHDFDCILYFNVLHHLRDTGEYLAALHESDRCLRSGGLFIAIEPCNKTIYSIKRAIAGWLGHWSVFFKHMHNLMLEERELMEYYIDNCHIFVHHLTRLGYTILSDRRVFHQRTLIARKGSCLGNEAL